jgi:hypothetical protein
MKHNSGSMNTSDFLFALLIIAVISMLIVVLFASAEQHAIKKNFYNANGYVEVKYKGMDIWIKKSDIELVITSNPSPEK